MLRVLAIKKEKYWWPRHFDKFLEDKLMIISGVSEVNHSCKNRQR